MNATAPAAAGPSDTTAPSSSEARVAGRRHVSLAGLVGLVVVAVGLFIGLEPLRDNSFLTHLATGRLILDSGLPDSDPYSFTAGGEPWVVQSWLASVIYGLVDAVAGGTGLRILMGLLTGGVALVAWLFTRPAPTLLVRVALVAPVLIVGVDVWTERPLLFGLLLLGVIHLAADGRLDPRVALPAMWLWANVHGSFPLGLVLAIALLAGARIDGGEARTEGRVLRWAAGGVALAAINPVGPRLLVFPIQLLARSQILSEIKEWQSPGFETLTDRVFLALVLTAVIALVRRPSYRRALPAVVFIGLALTATRNIGMASLVLIPLLAAAAPPMGEVDGRHRDRVLTLAAAVVGALALIGTIATLDRPAYNLIGYPVAAVDWLEDREMVAGDTRLVSRDFAGNFLTAAYGPDAHVFIDDRYDMYPDEVATDYFALLRGSGWDDILARHGAEAVLWDRDSQLAQILSASPEWRTVYADEEWLVFCPDQAPTSSPCRGQPDVPAAS